MIHNGDCLEILRTLPDCSVDAVVTDPPYGLSFMSKRWDYDVPSVEVWAECLRVLKPGGHLLAFAGTRTQHRMAVRIEDAGFEIRDMIAWVYGSGFPKSLDVSKAIDKAAGAEREVVGDSPFAARKPNGSAGLNSVGLSKNAGLKLTAPATPAAQQWEGWGTALKPAMEPITMARKPFPGSVAANVLKHGTGAINVDGCRVETHNDCARKPALVDDTAAGFGKGLAMGGRGHEAGRWPANLIHDGSDEVTRLMTGGEARFFYTAKAGKDDRDEGCEGFEVIIHASQSNGGELWDQEESLARLRVVTDSSHLKVIDASGVLNKSATEWNTLLSGSKSMDVCRQDMTCTTKTATNWTIESRILSCFQNLLTNESTAGANFGMALGGSRVENVEHGIQQIIITSARTESALGANLVALKTRLRISVNAKRNNHVTVKPTDLMRYLCRLVTPPGGVVLDPFMGSGSTGKAAILEGFQFVGIEREAEYVAIAEARIASAQAQPKQGDLF